MGFGFITSVLSDQTTDRIATSIAAECLERVRNRRECCKDSVMTQSLVRGWGTPIDCPEAFRYSPRTRSIPNGRTAVYTLSPSTP